MAARGGKLRAPESMALEAGSSVGRDHHTLQAQLLQLFHNRLGLGAILEWSDDHARLGPRKIMSANRLPDAGKEIHRDENGAGGRIRTVDPALMRRVLSPSELLRPELLMLAREQSAFSNQLSAVSSQLSALSFQHSAFSTRLSALNSQHSALQSSRLTTHNSQLH